MSTGFLAGAEGFDFSDEKPFAVLTAHCSVFTTDPFEPSIRCPLSREKPPHKVEALLLAGAEGFEPSTKVLEYLHINCCIL